MSAIVSATEAFANWPTLDEAFGCENCRGLFRRADNAICPHCGSASVFDAASALNAERQAQNSGVAVRAVRCRLRLPDTVDRNDPRAILEFATHSSYPTAPNPLLAVAHVAAQIIQQLHDEVHEIIVERRAAGRSGDVK